MPSGRTWVLTKVQAHLDNIAFSHSIFSLPFAYLGAFLAAGGLPARHDLFWITVALMGARAAALALNNLIDLKYDRLQPRFTGRPMVMGLIKPAEAVIFILISIGVFILAAYNLHPLAIKLWPLAIIPLVVYPYVKRFSAGCHFVLGIALAGAPVGACIAVRGDVTVPVFALALSVGSWIAAFDIVYGCQDVAFDKAHGLYSMPVRLGIEKAIALAKVLHFLSLLGFIAAGLAYGIGVYYYLGIALASLVLIYQHAIVKPTDLSRVTQAYFMRNGLVGAVMFIFAAVSLT
jgi:4-hydroxybenzoate polyprenyltransferase